jgi:hypothetical protein
VITFDTGALIALERRDRRMWDLLDEATRGKVVLTVPAPVVAEWWRAPSRVASLILARCRVEPCTERLARLVGEALAAVPGATMVDALVMVSASLRGDVVYTSDVDDLVRLRDLRFPSTRVLRV